MAPHSSTLAWKIPWTEEPDGLQSMGSLRLSDFTFTFHFHALEKEMATHSSVLAWRMPGTGEPGGLPSMGSHRVGHDWSDLAAAVIWNEMEFLLPSLIWLTSDLPDYGISHCFVVAFCIYIKGSLLISKYSKAIFSSNPNIYPVSYLLLYKKITPKFNSLKQQMLISWCFSRSNLTG